MHTFALLKIHEINGKISFYKLSINGKCEFDQFEREISKDGNLKRELINVQTLLQEVADGNLLPENKFRDLTPKGEPVKEYEIKTKHLRVYFFYESEEERIIVCGGKKTSQKKDIARFQRVKKDYLNANTI
jgi:putative component of toxin-antitoxin plasmid stabilization module